MKLKILLGILLCQLTFAQTAPLTPYEKGNGNQTATYEEMLKFYDGLATQYNTISIESFGTDDNGEPIRVVIYNPSGKKDVPAVLINNGIHPGEPDGIDATMMLMRDLATGKKDVKNLRVAAVQSYNISGMLRRGKHSRVNQNGPEAYGFRGNARNYDLNRDFIKADTRNTKAFQQIFHHFKPIFFIDNHVSNGADYPYTFTYISTSKERLGNVLGTYFHEKMQAAILQKLEEQHILTTPYVNVFRESPDQGFPAFMDSPRYATGYTTLFGIPGTVAETHMLKPYAERMRATYEYMWHALQFTNRNHRELQKKIQENAALYKAGARYPIQWKLNEDKFRNLNFKGYTASNKTSEVTGKPRLFYDRSKPFTKNIRFYDEYTAVKHVNIPRFYIIPKSEHEVIEHLKRNQIAMTTIPRDTTILAEEYRITDYKTVAKPYEGHYLHYDVQVQRKLKDKKFQKGDFLISTAQPGIKYLLETLEPEAADSFFNWNFFDAVLGQKEYFSDYVFEDTAAALLKEDPAMITALEVAKLADPGLAADPEAQLNWIYERSVFYEGSVNLYPVYRIL